VFPEMQNTLLLQSRIPEEMILYGAATLWGR
jgi:hypothetical protein